MAEEYKIRFGYVPNQDNFGGKKRPVVVIGSDEQNYVILKVTSQYESKSERIQQNFYPIQDYKVAGLLKPSYIDVQSLQRIAQTGLQVVFGELSDNDIVGLNHFMEQSKVKPKKTNAFEERLANARMAQDKSHYDPEIKDDLHKGPRL
jgi:hypothetical protein